jgi:ABC-type nitrate/sulfonate/bicarbonate transport system substrate-binding protein
MLTSAYRHHARSRPVVACRLTTIRFTDSRPGSQSLLLFFEYVLKQKGVDAETIKNVITNVPPPAREGAWLSGSGDFGIFNEPSTSNLERAGQVHLLASIGKELGRAENTDFFGKKSWYEQNREVAQKLTNAIAKAQVWMKTADNEQIAQALTRAGRHDRSRLEEARLIFERMLGFANHVGLYAEETGHRGEALGNFPQAFTHLALISAAFNLDRALGPGR